MISPVSFKGTYKVNNKDSKAFAAFEKYALNKEFKPGVSITIKMKKAEDYESFKFRNQQEMTLTVPDNMDLDVEAYCKRYGIEFTKLDNQD